MTSKIIDIRNRTAMPENPTVYAAPQSSSTAAKIISAAAQLIESAASVTIALCMCLCTLVFFTML